MSTTIDKATITVALLGNPNTGKSTLFSALVGVHQRIGNYPGVTVEKKLGEVVFAGQSFTIVDLPGTYSLAPRSPDEMVAVDVLLGRQKEIRPPEVIVCIVDASNLDRNLYLVSQALELGRPLVLVLNKVDIARERGLKLNVARLRERLQIPVVEMQAHRKVGMDALWQALGRAVHSPAPLLTSPFPPPFCEEVTQLKSTWDQRSGQDAPRYLVERLLLDSGGYLDHADFIGTDTDLSQEVHAARRRLSGAGWPVPAVETQSRYAWVDHILREVVQKPARDAVTMTDRLDGMLTHPVSGIAIFVVLMAIVFEAIFSWAAPLQGLLERLVSAVGDGVTAVIPAGVLQSLLADGVVGGVGAVLAFLPQIAMLFLFVAILEDCGYMARAAYLMDGMMSRVGLSGKSFIPLLSSFACAVPGIMATRVIENRRDRLVTILVAPLMSCSARLPVYTLMISAFIPNRRYLGGWCGLQGMTILALYAIGIIAAICVAKILRQTVLKGETPPFVMELPDYRFPSLRVVVGRVLEQCRAFVQAAGTLILAVTIIVWAAAYFPRPAHVEADVRSQYAGQLAALDEQLEDLRRETHAAGDAAVVSPSQADLERRRTVLENQIENQVAGAFMEQSLLGRLGKLIVPVVRPLGWDWRIGCSVLASFPAREVVIGAMGVIYNLGEGQDEESASLKVELARQVWPDTGRPVFTIPVALSIMVFFALCAQCAATLSTIYKETGSMWWPTFTFGYMTCLAYVGALVTYQVGMWLSS
ncbi:MAG: ferrous iron transport protein B [Pirellulaceae bacterium]